MSVRLRLTRIGKHKAPFYRIVAIDSRKARDAKPIETIGTYDALKSNLVTFNYEIFSKWISNGAEMSETVKKLLKLAKKQGFISN
jgi:small subunit ribosomal protein S16